MPFSRKEKPVASPRYLPDVLQAICEMKDTGGSESSKIVRHIKCHLNYSVPRNLSAQIKRALKHATVNGILKQRAGKFRINTSLTGGIVEARRRRKRQGKGRKSRRRRGRRVSELEVPVTESRRRLRRGKQTKRRRRSRRRSLLPEVEPKRSHHKANVEDLRKDMVYPDDHNGDLMDNVQCDNPECLCNGNGENLQNL